MPSQSQIAKARRQQASEGFGRMLRRWRELNHWSQYVAEAWAKAAGFELVSHGGLSPLEAGKTAHPRSLVFVHFAEMNRRLQAQDFSGVKSHDLLDRLRGAKPMLDDDGNLLQEEELWGVYLGIRRIPQRYWVPVEKDVPEISQEDADVLCQQLRGAVAAEARRRGIGLVRCLGDIGESVPELHRETFQDVLAGATTYAPAQLEVLWNGTAWSPVIWVETWVSGPPRLTPSGGGQ